MKITNVCILCLSGVVMPIDRRGHVPIRSSAVVAGNHGLVSQLGNAEAYPAQVANNPYWNNISWDTAPYGNIGSEISWHKSSRK